MLGGALCLTFPLLTATSCCILFLSNNPILRTLVRSPSLYIALLLSLLNSQKVVEGDLISYLTYFKNLENMSFGDVVSLYRREPVFYVLAWTLGNVFSFTDFPFKFFFSFFGYYALCTALERAMIDIGYSRKKVVLGLLLLSLSTSIFANSLHLTRQFLSLSLFVLAVTSRNSVWRYLGLILAALTHSAAFILVIFYFLAVGNKISKIIFFLGLIFYEKITQVVVYVATVTGFSPFAYFALRVSSDSFHDMPGISNPALGFLVVSLSMISGLLIASRNLRYRTNHWICCGVVRRIYEVNFYLGISVLVVQFILEFNEPAARLMYSYLTLTIFSVALSLNFIRVTFPVLAVNVLVLVSNFALGIVYGPWSYSNIEATLGCFLICALV